MLVGRATHDIVPTAGLQMKQFPDSRCVAISYNTLLLNDTSLRAQQHRMGLSDTNVCDCEQGIEDVHHFLFEYTRYWAARKILLQPITSICDDAECNRRLLMTVSALSNPEELQCFTKKQCLQILTAVFVSDSLVDVCNHPSVRRYSER